MKSSCQLGLRRSGLPYAQIGESQLHYEMDGAWPADCPVVFLHGLGSCEEDWILQRMALAGRWPMLSLDLRGHGRSSPARRPFAIAAMAADVAGLLDQLGVRKAHMVGLSLGATVALQLGIDRPDLTGSLTLVNGFARFSVPAGGRIRTLGRLVLYLTGMMGWLGRWIAGALFPHPDQALLRQQTADRIAANDWVSYGLTMWALRQFDVRRQVGELRAPTIIVAGKDDRVVPREAKWAMHQAIPGSRWLELANSGHATPIDAPGAFNAALIQFLQQVEQGRPTDPITG